MNLYAQKALDALEILYTRLGDPRTKNIMLLILALLSAFGMIAPTTATALCDTVLSLVF